MENLMKFRTQLLQTLHNLSIKYFTIFILGMIGVLTLRFTLKENLTLIIGMQGLQEIWHQDILLKEISKQTLLILLALQDINSFVLWSMIRSHAGLKK